MAFREQYCEAGIPVVWGLPLASEASKYPFSAHWKEKLSRREISITAYTAQMTDQDVEVLFDGRTPAIYRSFSKMPSDELLWKLAGIFASMRSCSDRELAKCAKQGLIDIGFPRPGRGRPKGRIQDQELRTFVEVAERAIADTKIFQKKDEAKASYGRNWARRFRVTLRAEGWPTESFDVITRSTPTLFAKHLAAAQYNCDLTHVSRALRAATRT
jgi:hypothetical protein